MINTKELIEKLPGSWNELTLKQFQILTTIEVAEACNGNDLFVGCDNSLQVVAKLGDVTGDELEELPYNQVAEIMAKIEFIATPPNPQKQSTLSWKKFDEISYLAFVTYMHLSVEPFKNLHTIIKCFSSTKLTDEQV